MRSRRCRIAARRAQGLDAYDAVVVGGALYAYRWHKDARRFVKSDARQLHQLPTYFFSSGPLDDSAPKKELAPVRGVSSLMKRVGAHRHATFGGRLLADSSGLAAKATATTQAGDWRDEALARTWAIAIATELNDDGTDEEDGTDESVHRRSTSWATPSIASSSEIILDSR